MSRRTAIISIIAALILGTVIGSAGGDEPEPVVETVTETVVETETVEVEVPVEVEVERTPQACLDAIDAARGMFATFAAVMDAASDYPLMVSDAMEAGMAMDVRAAEGIIDRMDAAHDAIVDGKVEVESNDFTTLASACERTAM